jgi:signal transduction histidine kinase/DNA-binding response OmpR family regulator
MGNTRASTTTSCAWPIGSSECTLLTRQFDWDGSCLGPISGWSQRFRSAVDIVLRAPVAMALLCGSEHLLIYNEAYALICGEKHPQAFGMSLRDVWPEAWWFNGDVVRGCLAGEVRSYRDEHFVLNRRGVQEDTWFDLYYAPVAEEAGAITSVIATVIETTARVREDRIRRDAEATVRQLNARLDLRRQHLEQSNRELHSDMGFLRGLFEQAPSFMAVLLGPQHVFELANASYLRLIGNRDVMGKPVRSALPELEGQGFFELLDQVYATGKPFYGKKVEALIQSRVQREPERAILDFVYQPVRDADGKVCGIFVEGIDVTGHSMAEERLRAAHEAGQIGTFEWHAGSGELAVSDSYRRIWGFGPRDELSPQALLARIDPAHRHLGLAANPAVTGHSFVHDEILITRADDGQQRWLARRCQDLNSESGKAPRYLGVVFDITERKLIEDSLRQAERRLREMNESLEREVRREVDERVKAEEALRQSRKMEAVGQLASGVAHDFNNVLQIISSNLQLMELDPGISALLMSRVSNAISAVERGSKLSSQLLAFARRQPLQPVVTNLASLLRGMEDLLQRALGDRVVVEWSIERGLWNNLVDPNQLENAVLNMAINARDAMLGAGRLALELANVDTSARPPAGVALPAGHYVRFSLADDGCGMPADIVDQVFDPFFTTKEPGKGTGLGLSMVYGFVKQSGGDIAIDSVPGRGTSIHIYLPRAFHAEATAALPAVGRVQGGSETVLVVEDDAAVRASTMDMLTSLGYRALKAENGQQALAILHSGIEVDLLFVDLVLPGLLSGVELAAKAVEYAPGLALLCTSGQAQQAAEGGANPLDAMVLPKPYGREQLAAAVRRQLASVGKSAKADIALPDIALEPLRILVVDDSPEAQELACEMLMAIGHTVHGVASARAALRMLASTRFDVLFCDAHLPGASLHEWLAQAKQLAPGLRAILTSGEGELPVSDRDVAAVLITKPYDLLQLQAALDDTIPAPFRAS